MHWKAQSIGQQGRGQDRYAVVAAREFHVLLVADGAGGMSGGGQAADNVIELMRAALPGEGEPFDLHWPARLLQRADAELACSRSGGQTTAAVVVSNGKDLWGASVGDSAVWLVAQTNWVDLTEPQVRKPLLGSGCARVIAFGPISACGILLLATDGLTKYASTSAIIAVLRNGTLDLEGKVDCLLALPRTPVGTLHDDVTVVIGEVANAG